MLRQRHRTISPPLRFAWLYRFSAATSGVLSLASLWLAQFVQPDPRTVVSFIVFAVFCVQALMRLGVRIGVNDRSLLIAKNAFSAKVVRWEWVAGFQWRYNLRGMGQSSERLWVTLDDGQEVATPVVRGQPLLADRDIVVSDEQADAFVAELERTRDRSRQGQQT